MTATAEDEWIDIEAVSRLLELASPHRVLREAAVTNRRRPGRGDSREYRLADVLALKELRQEVSRSPPSGRDFCDYAGALRIKERIEAYWQERGATVTVELVQAGYAPAMRAVRMDVRSDMLNGWPPEWIESK